MIGTSSQAALC